MSWLIVIVPANLWLLQMYVSIQNAKFQLQLSNCMEHTYIMCVPLSYICFISHMLQYMRSYNQLPQIMPTIASAKPTHESLFLPKRIGIWPHALAREECGCCVPRDKTMTQRGAENERVSCLTLQGAKEAVIVESFVLGVNYRK